MIPGINIIHGKASVMSIKETALSPLVGGFWGYSSLRTFFGSIDHLDWLKIDLNRAEINSEWKYTYTMLKLRVKQVTYKSKI